MSDCPDLAFHAALRALTRLTGKGMTTPEAPPQPPSEAPSETPPPFLPASASSSSLNNRTAACSRSRGRGNRRGGNNTNSVCFDMHGRGQRRSRRNPNKREALARLCPVSSRRRPGSEAGSLSERANRRERSERTLSHTYADFTPGLLLPLTDPPTILTTHHAQQTPTLRGAESPVCARMLQNRPAQPTSRTPRKWRI